MTRLAPFARRHEGIRHPERTAYRDVRGSFSSPCWGDVEVREWSTREEMARVIRRGERNAPSSEWHPFVALTTTEGF